MLLLMFTYLFIYLYVCVCVYLKVLACNIDQCNPYLGGAGKGPEAGVWEFE